MRLRWYKLRCKTAFSARNSPKKHDALPRHSLSLKRPVSDAAVQGARLERRLVGHLPPLGRLELVAEQRARRLHTSAAGSGCETNGFATRWQAPAAVAPLPLSSFHEQGRPRVPPRNPDHTDQPRSPRLPPHRRVQQLEALGPRRSNLPSEAERVVGALAVAGDAHLELLIELQGLDVVSC